MGTKTKLQWALEMAARGFRVFPLVAGGKEPALKGDWKKHATTDAATLRDWWAENPAYNYAMAMGDGWLGFDVDVKDGKPGFASCQALGVKLVGMVTKTPSGGMHCVFTAKTDTRNSQGRLGEGLDTRSAGGYLVGPGSVIGGVAYELIRDDPPQPAPPVIVQKLVKPAEKADYVVDYEADRPEAIEKAVTYLSKYAPAAVEGAGSDNLTFKVAGNVKDMGVSEANVHALMVEHYLPRGTWHFPPDAVADWIGAKVASAFRNGQNPPGSATPAADFAGLVPVEAPPAKPRPPSRWYRHGDGFNRNQSWLFYEMLPTEGVCLLSAPPQAGKTFLMLELARCGATGKAFFQTEPDEPFGTIFVFTGSEGSGLAARMEALEEAGKLPISATEAHELSERGAIDALVEDLRQEMAKIAIDFEVPVKVVVFETLAASGLMRDENDAVEASRAMRTLGEIGKALGVLVITSHHPDKNGKGPRGSGALPGAADNVIEIDRQGAESVRRARMTKARNGEQRNLGTFSLAPVVLGEDARGRPVKSMRISMGQEDRQARATKEAAKAEEFLWALENALKEAKVVTIDGAKAVEEDVLHAVFMDRMGGSYKKYPSNGNKAFKDALAWAEAVGRVECVAHAGGKYIIERGVIRDAA